MKERITSATVLALIAIVLAVGGNAVAFTLGKNWVGTKQLKKNAVTESEIKKNAITKAEDQEERGHRGQGQRVPTRSVPLAADAKRPWPSCPS